MIASPIVWQKLGLAVTHAAVEKEILGVLRKFSVTQLALSGGIDSSLMLYYMTQVHDAGAIRTFTIAFKETHPDYVYAKKVAEFFGVQWAAYIPTPATPLVKEAGDFVGDEIVRAFFKFVESAGVSDIICCDGIDEYMCGYYSHMHSPTEETYYSHMRRLLPEHLGPLDRNSGNVQVHLPYLDPELVSLFSQIPLSEKCDDECRKKFVTALADGKVPAEVIRRRKYGFCDAMTFK